MMRPTLTPIPPDDDDGIDYSLVKPVNLLDIEAEPLKTCTVCAEVKPVSDFGTYQRGRLKKGGKVTRQRSPRCRPCEAEMARIRRAKQQETRQDEA